MTREKFGISVITIAYLLLAVVGIIALLGLPMFIFFLVLMACLYLVATIVLAVSEIIFRLLFGKKCIQPFPDLTWLWRLYQFEREEA